MLADAKLLLAKNRARSAANRAYYAMFDAATAILTKMDIRCKSHKGVINQFGENVVKKGLVDKSFGSQLSNACELRLESDYDFYSPIKEEDAEQLVKDAEGFVNEVKRIIGDI